MLFNTIIKITHTPFIIWSSSRLSILFHDKYNTKIQYQRIVVQQSIRSNTTDQSSQTRISPTTQSTAFLSNKSKKVTTSSTLQCRLIRPDQFITEFEDLVFRRYTLEAPIRKHLGITEPDDCIMLFLRQILQRAKEDRVSLGFFNESNSNNQQHVDETETTPPVKRDKAQQLSHSSSTSGSKLPVCFIINHIENVDDPPEKNDFIMDLSKAPTDYQNKYRSIGDILSKVVENVDLFEQYKVRRIMRSFLAGVEAKYANQGLFTRLKKATIELAKANKCDLIYSKASSQFSTRANLKLGFDKVRVIAYNTYENDQGQRVFSGMSKTHQACTLTVKDLRV